jgi:uncharacterized protein (DUF1501 family)
MDNPHSDPTDNDMPFSAPSRRDFLRRTGHAALTGLAAPWLLNMTVMGEAAAFTATDYKALVCVFLFGGNDYANTVVTYDDASYAKYAAIRAAGSGGTTGMVLDKAALSATALKPTTPLPGGRQYALNPAMKGLANLFNTGKAAVQLNVGPLVVPMTRAQYNGSDRTKYPLPPKLFSHNDQQSVWQSPSPEGSTIGWGGKMGDVSLTNNTDSLFTCISLTGNNVMLSGDSALQYQCSVNGAIAVRNLSDTFFTKRRCAMRLLPWCNNRASMCSRTNTTSSRSAASWHRLKWRKACRQSICAPRFRPATHWLISSKWWPSSLVLAAAWAPSAKFSWCP